MVKKKKTYKKITDRQLHRVYKRAGDPEVVKAISKRYTSSEKSYAKQRAKELLEKKSTLEKIKEKIKYPSLSKTMTYQSGSPLKGLLKTKQSTVKVSGVREEVNLMRATW